MCGRAYSTITDEELEIKYRWRELKKSPLGLHLQPNFNFSPTQSHPVLRVRGGEKEFALLQWGLIPAWAKDPKLPYSTINARGETIDEKPVYRSAFKHRRCIVPLSGFVEWKREGDTKRPFKIFLKDSPIMSVAGVWETWQPKEGEARQTFSIITTGPNELMHQIHDRMPVILASEDEDLWLDPEIKDLTEIKRLIKPFPAQKMDACEISTLINSPRNNRPEVLRPL